MTKALLLASGGLDSTTLAYWLSHQGFEVQPLFFDYGQHCSKTEWETCQKVLKDRTLQPERICISDIYKGSSSRLIMEADIWNDAIYDEDLYIPYRTLLFFSAAAARAQTIKVTDIYSAFICTDHVKEVDCATEYLNNLLDLAASVGPARFKLPFRNYSKKQVAELARDLDVPIGETFSCQVYSNLPCGACANCTDRIQALHEAGLS